MPGAHEHRGARLRELATLREAAEADRRSLLARLGRRDLRVRQFREDLWYRLNVFPIVLPPLRERAADIPEMAAHFAKRAANRFGLSLTLPSPGDLALLAAYNWPGNMRELGTVIDRAAILGDGKALEISKALGVIPAQMPKGETNNDVHPSEPDASAGTIVSLDDAIRLHIQQALSTNEGRIEGRKGAAVLLKINPHTLRAKMRKLGIDWASFRT